MPRRHATSALACLLAIGALAGCGGGSDSSTATGDTATSRPAPPASDFPKADGRSLGEIVKSADSHAELVVSPAALAFYKGENRYPFGVFHTDRSQVDDAEVALYVARVPHVEPGAAGIAESGKEKKGAVARARNEELEQPAMGPYPAAVESLTTQPAFRAQTTTSDPDAATAVYTTDVDFPSNGEWRVAALIKQGDETVATLLPSASVGQFKSIPRVGEKAPKIHTPTPADTGGDLSKITTRIPPDTQNRVDYADALGREPIFLLFATPQFCQSRVCGPVVDVAEQVKEQYGDKAALREQRTTEDQAAGEGVPPAQRAVAVRDRPPGRDPGSGRGCLRRR